MGIRPAVGDAQPARLQLCGQRDCVIYHLLLELAELRCGGQPEADGHAGHGVDMRTALLAGEDGAVNLGGQRLIGRQDARAPRAVQGLMRGEADDVRVADRTGHDAGRDHACDVRDVGQQAGAHGIGNLAEACPVGHPRVRSVARDNHLGPLCAGQPLDFVVVEPLGLGVDAVGDNLVELAGTVGRAAVGQVAAVEQVHAHDGRAGRDQRGIDRAVGG